MTPFPWLEAMRLGFGVLKLPSRDFWGLTPRELAAAFEATAGHKATPLRRGDLAGLMARYPDEVGNG